MPNLQKICCFLLFFFTLTTSAQDNFQALDMLTNKSWFSGAKNYLIVQSPSFESFQYNENTFILRQNKCDHYEAPFIYLLFGEKRALLIDSGATVDKENHSLAKKVEEIMLQRAKQLKLTAKTIPLLLAHSHSHSDHIAGDSQFADFPSIEIIQTNDTRSLIKAFSFEDWPTKNSVITLGKRKISVIPTPGHQAQAISFYDHQTTLLITGDSVYPGRLYIREWQDYKDSIQRLLTFTKSHPVAALLGAHIEMSDSPNIDYPVESTYQPNEASLVLTIADLDNLNSHLIKLGDKPKLTNLGNMIIYPIE